MGIEVLQSATTVLRGRLEINQETTGVDLDGNNSIDPTEAVDGRSDDAVWDFFEANSTRIRQEVVAETITTLLELASDENQEVAAEAQRELGEIAANNSTVAERIAPQATNSQVCTQTAWEDFTGFWQVINNDSFGREVDRINARIARMPCFDLLVWDCIRDDAELASQRGEMSLPGLFILSHKNDFWG